MRTFVNKPGVVFDAQKTTVIFAEDINEIITTLQDIIAGTYPGIGGANITISDTEPATPNEGDLWLDISASIGAPVRSEEITDIVVVTQAEYDALTPDANTLYHIT